MSNEPVPDDVRDLIQRHIDSVAQLEALLFLRAYPTESWAASAIAERIYAPVDEIARGLTRLHDDGFVERDGDAYRYGCPDEMRLKADRLAEAYSRQLIPITNLVHAKPLSLRQFSNASRYRTKD
jgi:hypothetical protein